MDYTREPIVETVITPKDGCRLVVRNSKNAGQEEFSVDALEVVTFGASCFFRSLERPRAFMVPASDYELLEVRETKIGLKAASLEGSVRLPAGPKAAPRERKPPHREPSPAPEVEKPVEMGPVEAPPEPRHDRRSDRRRGQRRRRGREEPLEPQAPREERAEPTPAEPKEPRQPTVLPPPQTLIRDDLERLRQNEQYKGAFYLRESEEPKKAPDVEDIPIVPFNLQGDDDSSARPPEDDIYRATPAPSEE